MKYGITLVGMMLGTLMMGCYPPTSAMVGTESSLQAQSPQNLSQKLPIEAIAIAANRKFQLEVARTPQQQAIGLMSRTSLPDNRGMLFLFSSPQPIKFWMKNTLIPLDMIFLRDGEVQAIAANVPPCKTATCPTYGPDTQVNRVLELRGGTAKEIGLQVGDRVEIEFLHRQTQ